MNCRTCHYELSQCLDARLPSGRRAIVMQHVAECETCAKFWNELQRAQELVLKLPRHGVGRDFREQLFARIEAGEGTPPAVFHEPVPIATKVRYALTGAAAAAAVLIAATMTRGAFTAAPLPAPGPTADVVADVDAPRLPRGNGGLHLRDRDEKDQTTAAEFAAAFAPVQPMTADVVATEAARQLQTSVVWTTDNLHRLENGEVGLRALAQKNARAMQLSGRLLQELRRDNLVSFEAEAQDEFNQLIAQLDRAPSIDGDAFRGLLPLLRETKRLRDFSSRIYTRAGVDPDQQQFVLQRISFQFPDLFDHMFPAVSLDSPLFDPTRVRSFQDSCQVRIFMIAPNR